MRSGCHLVLVVCVHVRQLSATESGSESFSLASVDRCLFAVSVGMGSWGMGSLLSMFLAGESVPVSSGGALLVSALLVLPSASLSLTVPSSSGMGLISCGMGIESSVFEFCATFKSSLLVLVPACNIGMESDSGMGMESSVAVSAFGLLPVTTVARSGIETSDSSLSPWLVIDSFVADLDFSCDFDRLLLKGGGAV